MHNVRRLQPRFVALVKPLAQLPGRRRYRHFCKGGTQFLAIASGKGGVGKSTVTANLAVALARRGVRVALIDADIYGFSIPAIFGIQDQKPATIEDLIIGAG
ncbi:hypothetical protein GCM10025858_15070 [Alicyclobacillus sacchari]|nr:hypothetical protein GCM10025858_15070 [Alicyclobacillus sacchari]